MAAGDAVAVAGIPLSQAMNDRLLLWASRPPPSGGCALLRRVLEVPAVVDGGVAGRFVRLNAGEVHPVVLLERQRRDEVKIEIAEVIELQSQQHLLLLLFCIES